MRTSGDPYKSSLLAWKGGMAMYRAVVAHEAGRTPDFDREYASAKALLAEAATDQAAMGPVASITGGSIAVFGDRLPEAQRAAAWAQAYQSFSLLWKGQGPGVDKLPEHLRGELLSGLAMSAYRTGRTAESVEFVDKMIALLPDTAYQAAAKQWKAQPGSVTLTCKSCHAPGRLADRIAVLGKGVQ